jgi:hypothetical protein
MWKSNRGRDSQWKEDQKEGGIRGRMDSTGKAEQKLESKIHTQ